MCVRIDKAGKHHLAGSIELRRAFIGYFAGRSDPFDHAIANCNGAIMNDAEFTELRTPPGPGRPTYCHELTRVNNVQFQASLRNIRS